MVVLELKDLTVRFGGLTAVNKVCARVDEHQIVSIIGPNGAGKTTVFNAVTGIYEPTTGTVEFRQRPLVKPVNRRLIFVAIAIGLITALAAVLATVNVDRLWQATIKRNYAGPGQPFSYRAAWTSAVDYFGGQLSIVEQRAGRWSVVTADGRRTLGFTTDETDAKQLRDRLEILINKVIADPKLIQQVGAEAAAAVRDGVSIARDGNAVRLRTTTDSKDAILAEYDSPASAKTALENLLLIGHERTARKRLSWLALVGGFLLGAAGTAAVWNRSRRSPDFISRAGIGRTFQNIRLFQNMTVLENVLTAMDRQFAAGVLRMAVGSPKARREEAEIGKRAIAHLKLVDLESRANTLAKNLSYGDQRRLEIARALALEPQVLLLDEPAAGMNPAESAELGKLIDRIRDSGLAVLLIEHHMRVVMDISDRIVVLDYGSKIAEGTPSEVRANPAVIKAYLGDEEVT
jgi:ABC-type branched-subunit amino acid transport system ATPase component